MLLYSGCSLGCECLFGLLADGPDETDQLASQRGDDFGARFALVGQRPKAAVKALLSSPRDLGDLRLKVSLKLLLALVEARAVAVVSGGFDQRATQVRVAGLGDPSLSLLGAARVLGSDQACVAHRLRRSLEAREAAELGGQGDGCFLGYATQRLQCRDERSKVLGRHGHGAVDGSVEADDTLTLMIDF